MTPGGAGGGGGPGFRDTEAESEEGGMMTCINACGCCRLLDKGGLIAARAAGLNVAAEIAEKEAAALQRVADFLKPPHRKADAELAYLHEQGAIVASRLAADFRALADKPVASE